MVWLAKVDPGDTAYNKAQSINPGFNGAAYERSHPSTALSAVRDLCNASNCIIVLVSNLSRLLFGIVARRSCVNR